MKNRRTCKIEKILVPTLTEFSGEFDRRKHCDIRLNAPKTTKLVVRSRFETRSRLRLTGGRLM